MQTRLSYDPLRITASFDDPNLVSQAGLAPVMAVAEQAGLQALVRRHVTITAKTGVYPGVKVGCLVAGMAAGAGRVGGIPRGRRERAHAVVIPMAGTVTVTSIRWFAAA